MLRILLAATASTAALALVQPAHAQQVVVTGGVDLEYAIDGDSDLTTLSGYVEAESNGFYGGIELFLRDEDDLNEVDLYLGYRVTSGPLSYDIGYTHYFFPEIDDADTGEVTLDLGYQANDRYFVGTEFGYMPEAKIGSAYFVTSFDVTDQFAVGTKFGHVWVENDDNYFEGEISGTYAVTEQTAVKVTWGDGEGYKSYWKLNLSWDADLFTR